MTEQEFVDICLRRDLADIPALIAEVERLRTQRRKLLDEIAGLQGRLERITAASWTNGSGSMRSRRPLVS